MLAIISLKVLRLHSCVAMFFLYSFEVNATCLQACAVTGVVSVFIEIKVQFYAFNFTLSRVIRSVQSKQTFTWVE